MTRYVGCKRWLAANDGVIRTASIASEACRYDVTLEPFLCTRRGFDIIKFHSRSRCFTLS